MREFDISVVLSIVPGRLVAKNHMSDIYDILNYMTDDDLFTHVLPRACRECEPWLIKQYPWLADIDGDDLGFLLRGINEKHRTQIISQWVDIYRNKYGDTLVVKPLPKDKHEFIDPIQEAVDLVGEEKVIVATCDTSDYEKAIEKLADGLIKQKKRRKQNDQSN